MCRTGSVHEAFPDRTDARFSRHPVQAPSWGCLELASRKPSWQRSCATATTAVHIWVPTWSRPLASLASGAGMTEWGRLGGVFSTACGLVKVSAAVLRGGRHE